MIFVIKNVIIVSGNLSTVSMSRWTPYGIDPSSYHKTVPLRQQVLCVRAKTLLDGSQERRWVFSLDEYDGLEWKHIGSGSYVAFYPLPDGRYWKNGYPTLMAEGDRFLAYLGVDSRLNKGSSYQAIAGYHLAKVQRSELGHMIQLFSPGRRFRSSGEFLEMPRFYAVPSNAIDRWIELPDLPK